MMLLLLLQTSASAADARALSLEEAVALSRTSSASIHIAETELDGAGADKAAAAGGYLPSIGGAVSYSHTFLSEYDGLFDTTGDAAATGGSSAANPFADLPFGAADTWRVGVDASQIVYGGGRVRAQNRLAAAGQDLATLGLRSTRAGEELTVAQAYLDLALVGRYVEIARTALTQAETTLSHAQAAFAVGRQPEFEVVRAQVEVENQRVLVLQQERAEALAHASLLLTLGLPADTTLELTTPLEPVGAASGSPAAASASGAPPSGAQPNRLAVAQAEAAVQVAEASVALTRSAGLPQVAISGSLGFVAYPEDPLPPTEDWRTNLTAGAGISVPLFNGGIVRAQIRGAQLDVATARERARQVADLAALDTLDASLALTTARAKWTATAGTVAQAEKAYAIGEVRFEEGVSTQAELADARLLLQRALANRAQAGRDLQVATLRAQLVSDLPLSAR